MKIKIAEENRSRIEYALKAVNGNAAAHAFTTFEELAELARETDKRLLAMLPKSKHKGARLSARSGESVANKYKYTRAGTAVVIERGVDAWFIVSLSACTLFCNSGGERTLLLTKQQDEEAVKRLRSTYQVR